MDDSGDSGFTEGLPDGWVVGPICGRRLAARIKAEYADSDPAPWHNVVNADYWGPHFGTAPDEYAFNEKMSARLVATFQKAVISGQLTPSWFDGSALKSIPAHAFGNWPVVRGAMMHGRFEVDPLWPDDWQHWNNRDWAIPKEQFETWMQSDHALSMAGLPVPDSELPPCDVVAIASRKPSDASRVPLSEAITWIAFGVALDAERLDRAIHWGSLIGGDLQGAQRRMEAATASLLKAGGDGLVPMYGRHIAKRGEKGELTKQIDELTLGDYRKALIVSHDSLYYGEGLFIWLRAPNDSLVRGSERSDHFANVTVGRGSLLKCFPLSEAVAGVPMAVTNGELTLPGDDFDLDANVTVSPWWSLLQAVGWIATGSKAYVSYVAELEGEANDDIATSVAFSAIVTYVARKHCRCGAQTLSDDARWEYCTCTGDAGRALLEAIRTGRAKAILQTAHGSKELAFHDLAGVGQRPTCVDWLNGNFTLQFSSAEVIAAFLPTTREKPEKTTTGRKRPGPAPDPDWPHAIAKVTQDCIAAGYKRPRKRGDKAAIQTMLLSYMAEKDKHFSDDIAAKHAETVIAALPDN